MRFASLLATLCLTAAVDAADPAVTRSVKSGPWSEAATWSANKVPGDGDRVLVRAGHRVVYDVKSAAVVRGISISGAVVFATDKDTLLNVGIIKIQPGDEYSEDGFDCDGHAPASDPATVKPALQVGTFEQPIAAGKTAVIRLYYLEGMNKETCPAIVCCGGSMDFHGQPLNRTWVKLGASAKVGDAAVTLADPVTGWKIGDRIIVTATQTHGPPKTESRTEDRIVTGIDGLKLTLDKPLAMAHAGDGDYRGEVANL